MSKKRKNLDEWRALEEKLQTKLFRLVSRLEGVVSSRRRLEKRLARETVTARYVETDGLSVPCRTCNVDKGAECQTPSGEPAGPHASRVKLAMAARLVPGADLSRVASMAAIRESLQRQGVDVTDEDFRKCFVGLRPPEDPFKLNGRYDALGNPDPVTPGDPVTP